MHGLKKSGGPALKSSGEVVKLTVKDLLDWTLIIGACAVCVLALLELFDIT
jgi:hypothetical protein